jgi:integral membrane sensor domain MASE1
VRVNLALALKAARLVPPRGPRNNANMPALGRYLLRVALVAIVYWVAARLSLNLALVHGQVTPVWPPTGIAVVAILVLGFRVWPRSPWVPSL